MKKICIVFLCLCAATVFASADPMRFPYWQMIREVVDTVERQPVPPVTVSDANLKNNVEYPFELLRHLRVSDLLKAAVEGAQDARLQAALGKSPAEIDSLVRQNVALALEYMPMLIRDDGDLEQIALLMSNRNEDKVLRSYMVQNLLPGIAPDSFLSLSLHEAVDAYEKGLINPSQRTRAGVFGTEVIDPNHKNFTSTILEMVSHPLEDPFIQCTVMKIYDTRLYQKYRNLLENTPEVKDSFAASTSKDIVEFVKNNPVKFSDESNRNLKRCRGLFHDFAFAISGHITEGSVRDEQVKALTREILERMLNTVLGINQEILTNFLAGKPFDSSPFPKIPEQGNTPIPLENTGEPLRMDDLLKQSIGQIQ